MTVAGDLLTKVVTTFVADGLRRSYHELRSSIRRQRTLDRAISGGAHATTDDRLKKAINDLHVMIGNAKGQLTESVAAFIREIERSAIPDSLIRCILTNTDPTGVYPAFEAIPSSFADQLPFPAKNFFDAFYLAIRLRAESEVKDPSLLEFLQAQNKELARQLGDVIKALGSAHQISDPLTAQEISDARARLARHLEAANRFLTVETLQGAKRFRIKQLVVPPRLSTSEPAFDVSKVRARSLDPNHTPYLQFRTIVRRAVILGDPGGGKSTLTQLLCYDNANSIMLESAYPGKPQIDPTELRIPFRIILRSYDKKRQSVVGYSFFDYLIDQIKDVFDNNMAYCKRVVRHLLTLGNAVLIFDGLDEILEVDARRDMVTSIEQFTNIYAGCPAVVTSRLVGYRDAPMREDFSVYHLSTFNQDEVAIFAQKFIKIVEGIKASAAKPKADKFLAQTNSLGDDLRENPLMLGLMVYLFIYRGDVPSNKPEIYKECATLMFEKWDQRRDIIFKIPVDFDLLDLFSYLASKIFGSADTEDGVSREWLVAQLRAFFENWYLDKAKALHSARSLVDFITGRAWVMSEVGPSVFKFTHRTFLEYFFARHLLSSSESVSVLIRSHLLAKIVKSEWDVVSHLALQTAVFRDAGKMTQAADTIVDILRETTFRPKDEIALLTFVAGTLEYLLLPERRYRDLITMICRIAIEIGATRDAGAIYAISALIHGSKKREDLAKLAIYGVMRDRLTGPDSPQRSFVMFCIGRSSEHRFDFHRIYQRKSVARHWHEVGSNQGYFGSLRDQYRQLNYDRAMQQSYEARLYIFAYAERRFGLFCKHGLDSLIGSGPYLVLNELPNLILLALKDCALLLESKIVPAVVNPSDRDDLCALVRGISDLVGSGEASCPHCRQPDRAENDLLAEQIVRFVYFALKRKKNIEICARILIALGFALDVGEADGRSKRSRKVARLTRYMPRPAMDEVFATLSGHPLSLTIKAWNEGTRLSMTDGAPVSASPETGEECS